MDLRAYRHPFLFYFLSIIIPWISWTAIGYLSYKYPGENELLIGIGSILGLSTPFIVALILILPNHTLRRDFTSRLFTFSVSSKYLTVTFLLMPFSILAAQVISVFFGYSTDQFEFRDGYTFSSGILPIWFMLTLVPIIEELAWHSYGTDSLRAKFSLFTTTVIFASLWGIWHLPLSFIKGYYHSNLIESGLLYSLNFFVSLIPFMLIMNWLYYKTNRNILVTIIFHISAGFFNELFATEPMSKVIQTALLSSLALLLIIKQKNFFFNTKKQLS